MRRRTAQLRNARLRRTSKPKQIYVEKELKDERKEWKKQEVYQGQEKNRKEETTFNIAEFNDG